MGVVVISAIADNIISPLGFSSEENFRAVLEGKSCLLRHEDKFGLPEAFCGSLIDRDEIERISCREIHDSGRFTLFEKLAILSVRRAIEECGISADGEDVIFVLSTTKGNVDLLSASKFDPRCYLSSSAEKIAAYFGNRNKPITVSNACISGVCAQIAAVRELMSERFRYGIVVGCDLLSRFIVSGFQSFKALSMDECRPYDRDRTGLNLGEAVGTIILKRGDQPGDGIWEYVASSIHNDANHISGPSRTGEGSYRVLTDILKEIEKEDIGFINAHGTATAYNDEMESIAIHRAGLDETPVNGLKGYYGHTLGAAGIIETILSMKAIDKGLVLATKGFEHIGTTYPVNISNQIRNSDKTAFIKILSGFGGTNAGIAYRKGGKK